MLPSAEQIVRTSTGALGSFVVVGAFALAETGAFVGLVAPGEIVVVLGGVSAGHGTISLPALIVVVWACALTGDLISYTLGRRFGQALLLTHGAGLGVTEARVSQVERVLSEHTAKTLVLGRFIGIVRPLLPFMAGATHVPARRFVPVTACAAGLWAATFCCLGAAFWSSLDGLVRLVERGSLALGAVAVLSVAAVVTWRKLRGARQRSVAETGLAQGLALVTMVGADAVFGLDSIPAVYGVSDEPFIVFGANAFALLGLRPLFFLVSGLVRRLVYLPLGMAAVLAFIGVKLILHTAHAKLAAVPTVSTPISVAVIIAVLAAATAASLVRTRPNQMRSGPHSSGAAEPAR